MRWRWRCLLLGSLCAACAWSCQPPPASQVDAGLPAEDLLASDLEGDALSGSPDLPEDLSTAPDVVMDAAPDVVDPPTPRDLAECDEGEQECRLDQLFVCRQGTWRRELCPPNSICLGEEGCRELVCEPGQARCADDAQTLLICDSQGLSEQPFLCPQGSTQCRGGLCVQICSPGELSCQGDSVHRCLEDGSGTEPVQRCALEQGLTCREGRCLDLCEAGELEKESYIGCRYWGVDTPNQLALENRFAFVVSNAFTQLAARVRVEDASGALVLEREVGPGQAVALRMPSRQMNTPGTGIWPRSYRLTSNVPISAYQFNPLQSHDGDGESVASNDASLMLPDAALGTEHYGVSYSQWGALGAFLSVVSTADNNEILITPSADVPQGPGVGAMEAGRQHRLVLQRGQVLTLLTQESGADLTGTHIVSQEPVAVYGGVDCAQVPVGSLYCDHIEEALLPVRAWGRSFVGVPFARRGLEEDLWRVVASAPGTRVELTPPLAQVPVLGPGEHFTFASAEGFGLEASAPVTLVQLMTGSSTVLEQPNDGDPSMLLVPPLRQLRQRYIFLVPDTYARDWLTLVFQQGTQVWLDGEPLQEGEARPVPGTGYRFLQRRVEDGRHEVEADGPVGVSVYGYDRNISYAYPAGLDLGR